MNASTHPYAGHRYPAEIISHTVWLYFRFTLSFRDIEQLLSARGIILTYETVRQWCLKFGQPFANEIRYRQGRPGDTWFLDEVFIMIGGQRHYLWRAIDHPLVGPRSDNLTVPKWVFLAPIRFMQQTREITEIAS